MKRISKDDPRFTAKALGERSEELDELEVASEDLDAFEEMQSLARELESEFEKGQEDAVLSDAQMEALESASRTAGAPKRSIIAFPQWTYGLAACVAIAGVSIVAFRNQTATPEYALERPSQPVGGESSETRRKATSAELGGRLSQVETLQSASVPAEVDTAFRETIIVVEGKKETSPTIVLRNEVAPRVAEMRQDDASSADRDQLRYFDSGGARGEPERAQSLPQIAPSAVAESEEVFLLSPFSVDAGDTEAFADTNSLAGTRLRGISPPQLADGGASVTVVTGEFVRDVAMSDGSARLNYTQPARALGTVTGSSDAMEATKSISRPAPMPIPMAPESFNREGYDRIEENDFLTVRDQPLSTFSIDVDTASYANMRRMIESGTRPNPDAIRIEELINYFQYDYPQPDGEAPFSVAVESAAAPWRPEHQLLRIGLQGLEMEKSERPAANLVFLIDVSGSMGSPNKLPLAQESLKLLVEQMGERDRIAIVVYAGASGLSLPSTTANNQETIRHAIDNLKSGGSTNGGAGIELAYKVAAEKFIEDGINRVILCTDGDFNVGMTDDGSLTRLIETKAKSGVFFSAIGFGRGNYQDSKMEQLSNKGNGNYAYIDGQQEARKVFVDDMLGTLHTIAKDVKIQVDFNPIEIQAYRLIGYVNRKLAKEDFNDDKKDAGEIGAGHTVTALYEVVPAGIEFDSRSVDASKYQRPASDATNSEEWLTVKLRYKQPDGDTSRLIEVPFEGRAGRAFDAASDDLRFAASVAGFGMLLRDSEHKGDLTMEEVVRMARDAKGQDDRGLRGDFVELARKAQDLGIE